MTRYLSVGSLAILAVFPEWLRAGLMTKVTSKAPSGNGDGANYSWTTTVEGGRGRGPSDGKTEKNGFTSFIINFQDTVSEVILQGEKAAIKMDSRWLSQAEVQKAADDAGGLGAELIVMFRISVQDASHARAKISRRHSLTSNRTTATRPIWRKQRRRIF